MSEIQVVSKVAHTNKRWIRSEGFRFTDKDSLCPVYLSEAPRISMHLPIALIQQSDIYLPVAVQGLAPGQNLLLNSDGTWRIPYVPAFYRAYPFLLARDESQQDVLCLHSDEYIVDGTEPGEDFFNDMGEPTDTVKEILRFLTALAQDRRNTIKATAILQEMSLVIPWRIQLAFGDEEKNIDGLYKIDEEAINDLSGSQLESLRDSGALPLIYCHLLSTQHIHSLVSFLQQHPSSLQGVGKELNLDGFDESGNISFDGI